VESCIDHATGRAIEGPPIDESGEGEGVQMGDNAIMGRGGSIRVLSRGQLLAQVVCVKLC
jgi:hypothetical protein